MLKNLFHKTIEHVATDSEIVIQAPLSGKIVPLENVDDPVFAEKMVGDGIAIDPTSDTVVAPVAGTLTHLFPTGHAAGITTHEGIEILIHVGLDTVELKGQGFTLLAKQGQEVEIGTPLIGLDLSLLRKVAKSLVTPVVITNMAKVRNLVKTTDDNVLSGKQWVMKILTEK